MYSSENEKKQFYERMQCKALCHKYNSVSPEMLGIRQDLIKRLLGKTRSIFLIEQPFMCDYGYNIEIGENFYSNHNLLILDAEKVVFGDNVLIGPNCSFFTSVHSLAPEKRCSGFIEAKPLLVGSNVWICGNVTVLPGVKIGNNSVIGAGSVVSKDIPENVLAVGIPCKVIKSID